LLPPATIVADKRIDRTGDLMQIPAAAGDAL
jgi:hypothetical protein